MSMMAQAAADAARKAAREAMNAAEEALESSSVFVPLFDLKFDSIKQPGFLAGSKDQITKDGKWYAVKSSDISNLQGGEDDFGNKFTYVCLEDRCNIGEDWLRVSGTVQEVTEYINSFVRGKR